MTDELRSPSLGAILAQRLLPGGHSPAAGGRALFHVKPVSTTMKRGSIPTSAFLVSRETFPNLRCWTNELTRFHVKHGFSTLRGRAQHL